MKGKNIAYAYTQGSMYDNNSLVVVTAKEKSFRIKSEEILKLLKKAEYTEHKARKHTYLQVKP